MKIQLFKNKRGLIHGEDPMRISCDRSGILKIGTEEIHISAGEDAILPLLFHGCSANYAATFTTDRGEVFELDTVAVRSGRISPPSPTAVEFMELRLRLEASEEKCEDLQKQIQELRAIFDTDSLNFLIK